MSSLGQVREDKFKGLSLEGLTDSLFSPQRWLMKPVFLHLACFFFITGENTLNIPSNKLTLFSVPTLNSNEEKQLCNVSEREKNI
jgi:hypothetical protein